MVRIIIGSMKLSVAAGLAVLTAGVVSPETMAGRSVACFADGAAACRPSDLRKWATPEFAGEASAAASEFAGTVTAASRRLAVRITGAGLQEPVR